MIETLSVNRKQRSADTISSEESVWLRMKNWKDLRGADMGSCSEQEKVKTNFKTLFGLAPGLYFKAVCNPSGHRNKSPQSL